MGKRKPIVLGISGSLRNSRFERGSELLLNELTALKSKEELYTYLENQTKIRAQDFFNAGRAEGLPFDELYKNLVSNHKDRGLSNSEASLAASLYGALEQGVDIDHIGLASYFKASGKVDSLDLLKKKVLNADAIIISGPVYFGDRSSLVQSFFEFLCSDEDLIAHCKGLIFAGISVGAKRNGGQETQLIYQIVDSLNLGMYAVGNSSETTSQYGGTVVAGDVGNAWSDEYGLETSIGTGHRVGKVVKNLFNSKEYELKGPVKIGILLVQDSSESKGLEYIKKYTSSVADIGVEFKIIDITKHKILRCIACDLCPVEHAPRDQYTCIIKNKKDFFTQCHEELMDMDSWILAAYSPKDKKSVESVYQSFMERTRYIRRGSYMMGDRLCTAMIFSELNSNQNLHIRMLTSLIRHHTILSQPIKSYELEGKLLNGEYVSEKLSSFVEKSKKVAISRMIGAEEGKVEHYVPVGYTVSTLRNKEDEKSGKFDEVDSAELHSRKNDLNERVVKIS